ncbi:FAD-dependent monooxygenase [Kordia sp.]|uniref:FAD-dependent monooxygenase n=1 Tax=Kordia sp. TaxID=1965332 RepID=UPI0025B90C63|nr:FAD-dependent monooxygenase [Kordia sp.]MCH2193598.1 FAD-dependent monooxygenase [Kordia sp.]
MKTITIIGAGIGGLTTALALEQKGFQVVIYEQAKTIKPMGAGIMLASNAMKVYQNLGIDVQLILNANPLYSMNITDKNLNAFSKIDLQYFKHTYNLQSISIHRGKLQEILLQNLKTTEIHLHHTLDSLTKEIDGYTLQFQNGQQIKSSIILAADGIYSNVRNVLFPNSKLRSMKQVCWRGVANFTLPKTYQNELNEAWGNGDRFAFVQLHENQMYWYAVKSFTQHKDEFSTEDLSSYFSSYASIVQEIITTTPSQNIHETVIEDLQPISSWHDEFACLIGDAAHATTPNMGQGACQAIEDALVIANCLKECDTTEEAFRKYQKQRKATAHKVVKQSWHIGKISHWKHPVATFLRNGLLQIFPQKLNRIQLEKLFQLQKTPA